MSGSTPSSPAELLQHGTINVNGLVPWGSNYVFLAEVCAGPERILAIYKPRRGERPLWDFASGTLCQRERAAYVLSEALGWDLVPPTVLREGPQGVGSVQLFVDHDPDQHYFTFEGQYGDQIQRIQLFDVLANNADRKGGHILLNDAGRLWAIDHGVCFHEQYKLRTVVWEFAGTPIPAHLRADLHGLLERFDSPNGDASSWGFDELLSRSEVGALRRRAERLLKTGIYPEPGPGRPYPWPLV